MDVLWKQTGTMSERMEGFAYFNPFPLRPAQTGLFVILLCLMPDDITWERVKTSYLLYSFSR